MNLKSNYKALLLVLLFVLGAIGASPQAGNRTPDLAVLPDNYQEVETPEPMANQSVEYQTSANTDAPDVTPSWYNATDIYYGTYYYLYDDNYDGYNDRIRTRLSGDAYSYTGTLNVTIMLTVTSNTSVFEVFTYQKKLFTDNYFSFSHYYNAPEAANYTFTFDVLFNGNHEYTDSYSAVLWARYDYADGQLFVEYDDIDGDNFTDAFYSEYWVEGYKGDYGLIELEFMIIFETTTGSNSTYHYEYEAWTIDDYDFYFSNDFVNVATEEGTYYFLLTFLIDGQVTFFTSQSLYLYPAGDAFHFSGSSYTDDVNYNYLTDLVSWNFDVFFFFSDMTEVELEIMLLDESNTTVEYLYFADNFTGFQVFYEEGYFAPATGNYSLVMIPYVNGVEQTEMVYWEYLTIQERFVPFFDVYYDVYFYGYDEFEIEIYGDYLWLSRDRVVFMVEIYNDLGQLVYNDSDSEAIYPINDNFGEYFWGYLDIGNYTVDISVFVEHSSNASLSLVYFDSFNMDTSSGDYYYDYYYYYYDYVDAYYYYNFEDADSDGSMDLMRLEFDIDNYTNQRSNVTFVVEFSNSTIGSYNETYSFDIAPHDYDYFEQMFTFMFEGFYEISIYIFIDGSIYDIDYLGWYSLDILSESFYDYDLYINSYDDDDNDCDDSLYIDFDMYGYFIELTYIEFVVEIFYYDEAGNYIFVDEMYYSFWIEEYLDNYGLGEFYDYFGAFYDGDYIFSIQLIVGGTVDYYEVFEWYGICRYGSSSNDYDYDLNVGFLSSQEIAGGYYDYYSEDSATPDFVYFEGSFDFYGEVDVAIYFTLYIWNVATNQFEEVIYYENFGEDATFRNGYFYDNLLEIYTVDQEGLYLAEVMMFINGEEVIYHASTSFMTVFDQDNTFVDYDFWLDIEDGDVYYEIFVLYFLGTDIVQYDIELYVEYYDNSTNSWVTMLDFEISIPVTGFGLYELWDSYQLQMVGLYNFSMIVYENGELIYSEQDEFYIDEWDLFYGHDNSEYPPPVIEGETDAEITTNDYLVTTFDVYDGSYGWLALEVNGQVIFVERYFFNTTLTLQLGSLGAGEYNVSIHIWNAAGYYATIWMLVTVTQATGTTTTIPTTTSTSDSSSVDSSESTSTSVGSSATGTTSSDRTTSSTSSTTSTTSSTDQGGTTDGPSLPLSWIWFLIPFAVVIPLRRKS